MKTAAAQINSMEKKCAHWNRVNREEGWLGRFSVTRWSQRYDTIDHNILMRRLHGYGLCGDVHAWLTSYLRNRTNVVRVKSSVSQLNTIITGVPQGSVLGPILFNAYVAPLAKLLQQRNMSHHLYADDTQLCVTFTPSEHTQAFERMETCVCEVKIWLCDNGLVLNENNSEAIIIRSPNMGTAITISRVNIMRPIGGHSCRYPRSWIRYWRSSIDGISSLEHMSQRILSPVANC